MEKGDSQPPLRRSLGRKVLMRVVGWPILLLIGVLFVRWTSMAESRVFYVPSREAFETPAGMEDVSIPAADGRTLHGWFIRPASTGKAGASKERFPAVLHCHGNAGNVSSHVDYSAFLAEEGIAVLIFDYRGYGRSSPASGLDRYQLMEDSRAAMDYLLARPDVDPQRIGVLGVSLGGVFASKLAAERSEVKALCLISAFSGWSSVAGDHMPVLGWLLIPGGLDPAKSVASIARKMPLMIVHGEQDEIVNVRHAGVIEDAAKGAGLDVVKLIVPNADHNGVMFTDQGEDRAVGEFFAKALGK